MGFRLSVRGSPSFTLVKYKELYFKTRFGSLVYCLELLSLCAALSFCTFDANVFYYEMLSFHFAKIGNHLYY